MSWCPRYDESLIATLTGVVIGLVAVQTGSILPGMLFHLIHNSITLATIQIGPDAWQRLPVLRHAVGLGEGGGIVYFWPAALVGGVLSLALLTWFQRLPHPKSAEETQQERLDRALRAGA